MTTTTTPTAPALRAAGSPQRERISPPDEPLGVPVVPLLVLTLLRPLALLLGGLVADLGPRTPCPAGEPGQPHPRQREHQLPSPSGPGCDPCHGDQRGAGPAQQDCRPRPAGPRAFLHDRGALGRLVCGGVGVIGAYALSETVKLLVAQDCPCRVWDVATALACPAVGDWSWPSNHSVLAAAFATACIVALPRTAWFAIPAALVVGLSRVAAGVHYPHDVASGFALGVLVAVLAVALLGPMAARLPRVWRRELARSADASAIPAAR